MPSPRPSAALLVVALCAALSACTPGPAASPTPTPLYSSDAEALASAEQTYRDYIDAYNDVDLADPATFEPVYALSTGELLAFNKKRLTTWHADGWTYGGEAVLGIVEARPKTLNARSVGLAVCLKVSAVTLVNAAGGDEVSPDRPDIQSLFVSLERPDDSRGWRIENMQGREGEPPCT